MSSTDEQHQHSYSHSNTPPTSMMRTTRRQAISRPRTSSSTKHQTQRPQVSNSEYASTALEDGSKKSHGLRRTPSTQLHASRSHDSPNISDFDSGRCDDDRDIDSKPPVRHSRSTHTLGSRRPSPRPDSVASHARNSRRPKGFRMDTLVSECIPTGFSTDLSTTIPSLVKTFNALNESQNSGCMSHVTPDAMELFVTALSSALSCVDALPWDVRNSSIFLIARDTVTHSEEVIPVIKAYLESNGCTEEDSGNAVGECLNEMMSSLGLILKAAERELYMRKPLPPLPLDADADTDGDSDDDADGDSDDEPDPTTSTINMPLPDSQTRSRTVSTHSRGSKRSIIPSSWNLWKKGEGAKDNSSTSEEQPVVNICSSEGADDTSLASFDEDSLFDNNPNASQETWTSNEETLAEDIRATNHERSFNCVRASLAVFPELPPDFLKPRDELPSNEEDITYDKNGNILALSLERIVARLCSKDALTDMEFADMVFTCFRFWCTPLQFAEALFELYQDTSPVNGTRCQSSLSLSQRMQIMLRIVRAVKFWVNRFWRPEEDQGALDMLVTFTRDTISQDFPGDMSDELSYRLAALSGPDAEVTPKGLQERTHAAERHLKLKYPPKAVMDPIILTLLRNGKFDKIHPAALKHEAGAVEVARQLTIIESQMYLGLEPEDVLRTYMGAQFCDAEVSERLKLHGDHTSDITRWVSYSVVSRKSPSRRASAFSFFTNVATHCVELRNLSTAHSIWIGLSSYGQEKLVLTQSKIKREARQRINRLNRLFNPDCNFSACAELIKSSSLPAVPLMAAYRHEMQVMVEKHPAWLPSKTDPSKSLINIFLFKKLSALVREMEATHVAYKLHRRDEVYTYILHSLRSSPSMDELTEKIRSVQLEESTAEPTMSLKQRVDQCLNRRGPIVE